VGFALYHVHLQSKIVSILARVVSSHLCLHAERKNMIDLNHGLPVVGQCQILDLARSTAYLLRAETNFAKRLGAKELVALVWTEFPWR
jgi:hypothetical protein